MAGVFTSVLDVTDRISFVQAVDDVLASARSGLITGAPMAVLVQPQLSPRWGGVLFGADPISGRTDRLLLSACEGGPDRLVSGLDGGWTATLSPRGRVIEAEPGDGALGIPSRALTRPGPPGQAGRGCLRRAAGHRVGDRRRRHRVAVAEPTDHHRDRQAERPGARHRTAGGDIPGPAQPAGSRPVVGADARGSGARTRPHGHGVGPGAAPLAGGPADRRLGSCRPRGAGLSAATPSDPAQDRSPARRPEAACGVAGRPTRTGSPGDRSRRRRPGRRRPARRAPARRPQQRRPAGGARQRAHRAAGAARLRGAVGHARARGVDRRHRGVDRHVGPGRGRAPRTSTSTISPATTRWSWR